MNFSSALEVKKAFEEVYTVIFKTSFLGLPVANHDLSVRVVGLRETNDFYTFCLITPWMLNQIAVPKKEDVDVRLVEEMREDYLEHLGTFYVSNVISPMDKVRNMERAIRKGEKLADELFANICDKNINQSQEMSRRDFFRKMSPKN
ncbi:MAG: [NiFe]-hydrogenase assembly chaperone HybE [bacterium]